MDVGIDLEFVVGHLEFFVVGTDAENHAILAFFTQHDALFKIRCIDRMRKIDRGYDLFRCRISRVLIKLRLCNLDYKWRCAEFRLIVFQAHLLR